MNNKKQFQEYMLLIGERHDKKFSEGLIDITWKALESFSDDECIKAFNHVIKYGKFWKDILPDLLEQLEGTKEDQGELAWTEVYDAIRNVGCGQSIRFSDPVIHSAIEKMGGWIRLAQQEEADSKWNRKEFLSLYRACSRRNDHPAYLTGMYEEDNELRGFNDFIPKIIEWSNISSAKRIEYEKIKELGESGHLCPECKTRRWTKNGLCADCHMEKHGF